MMRIFRASKIPGKGPSDDDVEFFDDNRELFTRTMQQVMDEHWGVPKRRSWLLFKEVAPKKLNLWVFHNRHSVSTLIYGRDMEAPSK